MKFIDESAFKYLSVKAPFIGAFILGVIPVLLQNGMDLQIIPVKYHAVLLTVVLPLLAAWGKKVYQPELHTPQIQGLISQVKPVGISATGYDTLRKQLFKTISQTQVDNIELILKACNQWGVTNLCQTAYVLATAYHETAATMQPIEEYGKGKGKKYGQNIDIDGSQYKGLDHLYYGRGYVQLTWLTNYVKMKLKLGIDFVNNPDLALVPEYSAQILVIGMRDGDFTGKKLATYINDKLCDYQGARRIINGTDKSVLIAGYARIFESALRISN